MDELLETARAQLGRLGPRGAHEATLAGAGLIDIRAESQIASDGTIPGALLLARKELGCL